MYGCFAGAERSSTGNGGVSRRERIDLGAGQSASWTHLDSSGFDDPGEFEFRDPLDQSFFLGYRPFGFPFRPSDLESF